jgi:hypothetical protein
MAPTLIKLLLLAVAGWVNREQHAVIISGHKHESRGELTSGYS